MKFLRRYSSLAILFFIAQNAAFTQVTQPPFSVELEEVTWSAWPGLHSFAAGEWDGRWIIATGRTGGLHGFLPPSPFSVTEANRNIFMLDPVTGEQWSADIFSLPDAISDQLRSTNAEFIQIDKYLYIFGGYGKDTVSDNFITFPSMIAIDLEQLSDALLTGAGISSAFRQIEDSLFQVTGGEIEMLGDKIYLFGGHVFTGEYSKPASPAFTQVYTNELRKFILADDGTTISISDIEIIKDTANFHRRDLNFVPVMTAGEIEGLAAWSGVFQYDADWVWFHPVYFFDDGYAVDTNFSQVLNHYTCPVMGIYDSVSENYYATFFGGIGQNYYNEDLDTIKQDLNVPFVNDISTIIKYADGTTEQLPMHISFDALLGSNMAFILSDTIPQYENGVIKLHQLDGNTFAGYLFGGIDALLPNFTPSTASNRLFKVWINYEAPISVDEEENGIVKIYPNPAHDYFVIKNNAALPVTSVQLFNQLGEEIKTENVLISQDYRYTVDVKGLPEGIYFLLVGQGEKISGYKIIRQ